MARSLGSEARCRKRLWEEAPERGGAWRPQQGQAVCRCDPYDIYDLMIVIILVLLDPVWFCISYLNDFSSSNALVYLCGMAPRRMSD